MSFQATPQQTALAYHILSRQAHNAVADSLMQLGYDQKAILEHYSFTASTGVVHLNALAFADPIRRTPTEFASLSLYNYRAEQHPDTVIPLLAQISAPLHILHNTDDNQFELYGSRIQDGSIQSIPLVQHISYDRLNSVLADFAVDITPQRIAQIKQGQIHFSHPELQQLAPLQLALWAIDVTSKLLVDHFGAAITDLRAQVGNGVKENQVTQAAIQMLGALILADTGILGENIRQMELDLQLTSLMQAAWSEFPRYFTPELISQLGQAAETAYHYLRQIRYAGFAPDMLSDLYVAAYDKSQRKQLGRYDTPLYLTRKIWQMIPVEFLRPELRTTIDMTCGWGSFLIAGWERLSQISDMRNVNLREYLRGNDIDPFTAQIAGLGLVLATSQDTWQIDYQDARNWDWLKSHQPGIIVGNPPFSGRRDTPNMLENWMPTKEHKRVEAANAFLDHAIQRLALGGFLAMVLPSSLLISEAGPQVRKQLLEQCDLTEIWQLPGNIFHDAKLQPIVIFARKHTQSKRVTFPVWVRNIQKNSLDLFKQKGIVSASNLTVDQSKWDSDSRMRESSSNTYIISPDVIITSEIRQILEERCQQLDQCAEIFPGVIRGKGNSKEHSAIPSQSILLLTNAQKVIKRSWYIEYGSAQPVMYPDDFEKPRLQYWQHLMQQKVLMISSPNPSWGRRAKAVIERQGYVPSHSFWVITPIQITESSLTLEALAAILNWYVSNAWIADHRSYTWIEQRILSSLPIPSDLTKQQIDQLTQSVQALEQAAQLNQPELNEAERKIDQILQDAYGLTDAMLARLKIIAEWDEHPQETLDPEPDRSIADYWVSGIVEAIDPVHQQLTVWISGFANSEQVSIDSSMPGWFLRPNTAFRACIPYTCKQQRSLKGVIWNRIEPQQYTYLDDQELLTNLDQLFYPNGASRHGIIAEDQDRFS